MNYKEYQRVCDLSWTILARENISELPINIILLCKNLDIKVKYDDLLTDNDGASIIINDVPYIFVKRNCTVARQRFTVAHELGHILLGHVGNYELTNRELSPTDNPIEQEANMFAARLLAPACVLWGCGVKTAVEIETLCGISRQAAEYRMQRMNILYARNKFLTSALERKVYEQFQDFIKAHQHLVDF